MLSVGFAPGEAPSAAQTHPFLAQVVSCARRAAHDLRSPLPIPALRLLGLLVATPAPEVADMALASGALLAFRVALKDSNAPEEVRRDVAWALSNIAAGTKAQAAALLSDAPACDALFASVEPGAPHAVRRESAWAIVALAKQLGFQSLDARRVLGLATAMMQEEPVEVALQRGLLDAAELALRHGDDVALAQGLKGNPVSRVAEEVGFLDELEELRRGAEPGLQRKAEFLSKWFGARSENSQPDGLSSKALPVASWGPMAGGSPWRAAYRLGA